MHNQTKEKLQTLYRFIESYHLQYGYPPSYREMAKATGIASLGTLHTLVNYLAQLGKIHFVQGASWKKITLRNAEEKALLAVPLIDGINNKHAFICPANTKEMIYLSKSDVSLQDFFFVFHSSGNGNYFQEGDILKCVKCHFFTDENNGKIFLLKYPNIISPLVRKVTKEKNFYIVSTMGTRTRENFEKEINPVALVTGIYRKL